MSENFLTAMKQESSAEQININTEIASNAIKKYSFQSPKLKFIKHLENTTYKLSAEQGDFLVRVYCGLNNTVKDIESEAKIIEYLISCNNYTYQKPIYNNSDNFVSIGEASGISKPVSILSWIDSPIIGHDIDDISLFEKLGKLFAHIHKKIADWQKPINFHRPTFDADSLIGKNGAFGYANSGYKYFDRETVSLFESVYQRLIDFEAVNGKENNFGIIHGDLHLNNVILHQSSLIPIDFDDSGWGYYIYDLAVILANYWGIPEYSAIKINLIKGYRTTRKMSDEIENQIPLFIAVRYICIALFLAGKSEQEVTLKQTASKYIQFYLAKLKNIISCI
ncbi:stress response kinase A [Calothrix parasitica NIES-267]|uniref:Stress response kinase A n=1 Tax=Calothrix parasitica NIES-267 TaxID=1973488 RepID=A0A1Z4M1X3_9CYAN|nr:stress response kinase A [Calothrix parasitica NIES-267]